MSKYSETELEILRTKGKKGLKAFHEANRKCSGTRANFIIESKKYRDEKYRPDYND